MMREIPLKELQALAYRARIEGLRCATVAPTLSSYYLRLYELADALHALELRDRGADADGSDSEELEAETEDEAESSDKSDTDAPEEEAPRFGVRAKKRQCAVCGSPMWRQGSLWICDQGHEAAFTGRATSDPE